MKAPKTRCKWVQWGHWDVLIATAMLLLLVGSNILEIRGEVVVNSNATCEDNPMGGSAWMPFVSVLEKRSCLDIPMRKVGDVVDYITLHTTGFEEADESIMMSYAERELSKLTSVSSEILVEDLSYYQSMFAFRRDEVQRFWDNPGKTFWLDCVYVMDSCIWDFTLARLNNSGITLFDSPFINYEEPQSYLNAPGTLCMAISKTILKTDLFRQRRPRVLVVTKTQVTDLDIQLIAQGLPSMGKVVVLGDLTSAIQAMFEVHGFHVLEQENLFVAVLKPQIMQSDSRDTTLHSIGKVANVYVANMDEDYIERWPEACENFPNAGLDNLWPKHERFRAINGRKELAITAELRNLFRIDGFKVRNPYKGHGFRQGALGCSATHILLWTKLSKRTDLTDLDSIIILEDDFYFAKDVANLWEGGPGHSLSMSDPRWDVMMLGFDSDAIFSPGIPVWDGVEAFPSTGRSLGYGSHGYIIRKRGAKRLLRLVHTLGMPQGVDHFIIEAWVQKHIVAYKSVPWLVYAKSKKLGYKSHTEGGYVRSRTAACPKYNNENSIMLSCLGNPSICDSPAITNLSLHPDNFPVTDSMETPILHPDLLLKVGVKLISGMSSEDMLAKHPCAQLCLQYGHKNFSYPPPQCYFLFDTHVQSIYSDPERMQIGQETKIFVALLTADSQIWKNSISEPLVVNASTTVAHMELHEVQHNQLALEVVVRHAPANFMSIHSSSLLCVNEHCDPLGSFPIEFNISVSSDEGVVVRATLQTLGSMRDLAIPIEHFYRTSSGTRNPVNVRALLGGL